jgi:HEAT repeat protein
VRGAAFDALALPATGAASQLLAALEDTHDRIVWRAALILGALHAYEAVDPLITLLGRAGTTGQCAAWALGEIGDGRASPALLNHLSRGDPLVSREAAAALKKIGSHRS